MTAFSQVARQIGGPNICVTISSSRSRTPPFGSGAPRHGRIFRDDQRLGCAVAFIGFSVPPRAFHGRLNNPGHQWGNFRDEASDVTGKAFDGVVAKVQRVARPVMVLRYRKFAERARLFRTREMIDTDL